MLFSTRALTNSQWTAVGGDNSPETTVIRTSSVHNASFLSSVKKLSYNAAMPTLSFTQQLRRFTETPEVTTPALTLRAALEDAFATNPCLRGYILDDQGHLRQHVVVFIDGQRVHDRVSLANPLSPSSNIHVLQALSGG
jgi:hypothetical protein